MAGDDHGLWLKLAMIMFLTWSLLFYGVRLWGRLRVKTAASDDVVVTCALAISFVGQGIMYTAVHKGYGKRSESLSTDALHSIHKYIYAAHYIYVISVGTTRVASALSIEHIAQQGPYTRRARAMAWLSGAWTFTSLLVVAIRPPYMRPWLAADGQSTMFSRWIGVEATGLAVEVALWALAIHLVMSLQMQQNRRIFIIAAFGFPAILTAGALHFSIIATSVTALKPFLTVFDQPKFGYGRSAESGDPYYKLEMFRRVNRQLDVEDDSANWRPHQGSSERSILSEPDKVMTRKRGDSDGDDRSRPYHGSANRPPRARDPTFGDVTFLQTHTWERLLIQKTTEFVVRYEEDKSVER
ncbi:hypothetical protein LMH87_001752 [Akanthomyces muscarius]|uniref:Rhodopsin domain-containing protein n=1 Tax=Akanthomyces muscarius TaxID=2231603 RepID=A0A9W8Q757_AKAMU|nr:hypothetical protein LMH87_001752 [Akanthomyces muscarius]KAJ4147213.1 hypothetical protein LMH87_001752 [Akanthomyces muscarius]